MAMIKIYLVINLNSSQLEHTKMIITATGVYGNNETEFFEKLLREKITLFIFHKQG